MIRMRNATRADSFLKDIPKISLDLPCSPELLGKLSETIYEGSLSSMEEIGEWISRDQSFS
ncbi:MAG: HDOD domain-containing protein, partial [Desulfovibrionales bacterium]